jgi:peroxiredoxin
MNYSSANNNARGDMAIRVVVTVSILALAAATMLKLGAARRSARKIQAVTAAVCQTYPEFALKDLSGKQVKLSDYRGKIVVVNFWATWCAPCRMEIPAFIKLREQYRAKGLEVIGISLDTEDDSEGVATFVSSVRINYPVVVGNKEVVEAFGPINAIPTTFIIDRQGRIKGRHLGMLSFDEVENAIKPLL